MQESKKQKTDIIVKTFYDGELEAAEVFMNLIAQKANLRLNPLANHHCIAYNKSEHQSSHLPSGSCR